MRVLVIGSGGMLGHMLVYYLAEHKYEVSDISRTRKCHDTTVIMDVLSREFDEFISTHEYDAIINCAALLHESCLADKEQAVMINSWFPHHLQRIKGDKTYLIQISSGGVYKGDNAPYNENSVHDTITFYGKSKSIGEIEGDNCFTIRSDVVGPDMSGKAKGIFNWIMTAKGEVEGYSHMSINGVTSLEYARFLESALNNRITGIYNLHSDGSISKADFLKMVIDIFGLEGVSVKNVIYPIQNNSLSSIRMEIPYIRKTYAEQLVELKDWIDDHKMLYSHYYKQ